MSVEIYLFGVMMVFFVWLDGVVIGVFFDVLDVVVLVVVYFGCLSEYGLVVVIIIIQFSCVDIGVQVVLMFVVGDLCQLLLIGCIQCLLQEVLV